MWDTIGAFILAKMLYYERLEKAEIDRQYRRVGDGTPKLRERILMRAGDLLISVGTKLKGRHQSKSVLPLPRH